MDEVDDEFVVVHASNVVQSPKVADHLLKLNDVQLSPTIYTNTIQFENPVDTNARILQNTIDDIRDGRYI